MLETNPQTVPSKNLKSKIENGRGFLQSLLALTLVGASG